MICICSLLRCDNVSCQRIVSHSQEKELENQYIRLGVKLMWEIIRDGVRPAKRRCKCYCFWWDRFYSTIDVTPNPTPIPTPQSILLVLLLHDRRRHPTDAVKGLRFNGHHIIFNTHTILLTKSISSLSNLKSNNYKKKDTRIRKKKTKPTTTMAKTTMMTQQRQPRPRRLQYSMYTCRPAS